MARLIGEAYVREEDLRVKFLLMAGMAFRLTEEQAEALWDELKARYVSGDT